MRRCGARRVEHEVEERLAAERARDVGVADLTGFRLHGLIHDVVGINTCPVAPANRLHVVDQQLFGFGGGLELTLGEPLRVPFRRSPEERVAAQLETLASRVIGDRVEGAEVECVR